VGAARAATTVALTGDALAAAQAEAQTALAPLADGKPTVESKQVFEVGDGHARVRIVPVRYSPRVRGPLANVDACALAITDANRPIVTVQTIGVGYTETVGCTGLDSIAFPDLDGDRRFEIALIYSTITPPNRYGKMPVVLRRGAGGAFIVDEALGAALDARGGITTIAGLRAAAAQLTSTHHDATK